MDVSSLVVGIAGSGAVVLSAWLTRTGNRNSRRQTDAENETPPSRGGVSLTKRFMDGQQRELEYCRRRVHELEAENDQLRARLNEPGDNP